MATKGDLIGVIEAAYDLDAPGPDWLARVVDQMAPLLNEGAPVAAFAFAILDGGRDIVLSTNTATDPAVYNPDALQRTQETMKEIDGDVRRAYIDCPPFTTLAHVLGRKRAAAIASAGEIRCENLLGLRANSESGAGILFCSPVAPDHRLSHAKRLLWTRVAAHLGSALRLRGRVEAGTRPDAIVTPGGKTAHAERAAESSRAEIEEAARRVERARGRLRRDPTSAAELWRAMVRGDWTLVEWFDHDGKRFLVAHRNEHRAATPPGDVRLSRREWQVVACAAMGHTNKLIAYDLGLSEASVAEYVRRAATKLGVTSRVGLVRVYREAFATRRSPK